MNNLLKAHLFPSSINLWFIMYNYLCNLHFNYIILLYIWHHSFAQNFVKAIETGNIGKQANWGLLMQLGENIFSPSMLFLFCLKAHYLNYYSTGNLQTETDLQQKVEMPKSRDLWWYTPSLHNSQKMKIYNIISNGHVKVQAFPWHAGK